MRSIRWFLPLSLLFLWGLAVTTLAVSYNFGLSELSLFAFTATVILFGIVQIAAFVAAVSAAIGWLDRYWSSGYPVMTLALIVGWAIWRSQEMEMIFILLLSAAVSFAVSFAVPEKFGRVAAALSVTGFVISEEFVQPHGAQIILLGCALGIFARFYVGFVQGWVRK